MMSSDGLRSRPRSVPCNAGVGALASNASSGSLHAGCIHIQLHVDRRDLKDLGLDVPRLVVPEPGKNVCEVPERGPSFMDWLWEKRPFGLNQFPHVLSKSRIDQRGL